MQWIFSSLICPANRQGEQVAEKERWLIISYFSNVDGMACASHIDDRLPFFQNMGVDPILLTSPCGLSRRDIIHVRVPSLAPSGIRFELRHRLRRRGMGRFWYTCIGTALMLPLLPFYLLEKLIVDLDSQWSWFPLPSLCGQILCKRYRPSCIYSTGGPVSGHIAAAIIARRVGIPWIAEFQDPLVHDDWQRSNMALKFSLWAERFICSRARAVIFLTREAMTRAMKRAPLGNKGKVVYPGASQDGSEGVEYTRGPHCRFAHYGTFSGSRNPRVFLEALGLFLSENPDLVDTIRFDVYGSLDQSSINLLRGFTPQETIRYHGRLPRDAASRAMKQSDVLLLAQNTDDFSAETIPSKFYEYLLTGRPILGLVYKNPELASLLVEQGHVPVDASDVAEVKKGIDLHYRKWAENSFPELPRSPYTVTAAVREVLSIAAG